MVELEPASAYTPPPLSPPPPIITPYRAAGGDVERAQSPYGLLPEVALTTATIVRLGPPDAPLIGSVEVEMIRRYGWYADVEQGGTSAPGGFPASMQFTVIVAVPKVVDPLVTVSVSPAYVLDPAAASLPMA
jgi:hypothetical protein